MTIDIKTAVLEQKRHTFTHIAKRLGEDRPASRYEEGTLDIQATINFHYRPLWAPEFELYDRRRTKVKMADWYALRDPRQFYYANYNITRAGQLEAVERNFDMVEKRGMLAAVPAEWLSKLSFYLLPLRHYEWAANMNNCTITNYGYGTALTAATTFAMGDRLGIAQLIGRIGIALGGNSESALNEAKEAWMSHPAWAEARHVVEDTLVVGDPIELFVAQNLSLDGIVYSLIHGAVAREGDRQGAASISFLCSFLNEWADETTRWVDHVVKTVAAESDENRAIVKGWFDHWTARAVAAFGPVANEVLGAEAAAKATAEAEAALRARAEKLGVR